MNNINQFINEIESLHIDELKSIADMIMQKLKNVEASDCLDATTECRKCGSHKIAKFGKDKNGKQRYKCMSCGSTFTATTGAAISCSRHSFDVWKKYIELLLSKASLEKCANECNISVKTAFIWRHKILSLLQKDQDCRVMNGIVEADETFFGVSYKGNHTNSKRFEMPRPAYQRGTDNKKKPSQMACVMCAYERKGHTYGELLGIGTANEAMLDHAFKGRLLEDTVLVTDKASYLKKYFDSKSIEQVQTASHSVSKNQNSPPEIKGVYHIQNVNNLHHRLKSFLQAYNGVATKYLNHYVNLYIWIENYKKLQNTTVSNELRNTIVAKGGYIPSRKIFDLPPNPSVA